MRAHFQKNLVIQDEYSLRDEALHHLMNVIRIEKGESLLLLDGNGLFVETSVESVTKKEIRLSKKSDFLKMRTYFFDLILGMPKRDALELSLKEATELGFETIYLIRSDFSQIRFPEEDRLERLLVSALEQSNAAFMPKVIFCDWKQIPWNSYRKVMLLDSQTKKNYIKEENNISVKEALIVGPEAGFSTDELNYLSSLEMINIIHLPTPILRTPTAVATGAGIMIQNLL